MDELLALGHNLPPLDKYVWTTYCAPGFFLGPGIQE